MITLREKACIVVCIGALGWVVTQHRPVPMQTSVSDDKVVKTQQQTHKVVTTVTKTVKPDGTKTTITKTEKETSKVSEKTTDKQDVTTAPVPQPKPNYSADVSYEPDFTRSPLPVDVSVGGGARVGGTDLWLTAGFSVKNKQVRVGLRYDF